MLNNIIYDNFMDFSIQFDTPVAPERGVVIGFGVFDGVHPGHRLIMHNVCEMAESVNAVPAAVTFVPHPRQILSGADSPGLLISVDERLKQLRTAGAESVGIISFTPDFAALTGDEFLNGLLKDPGFTLKGICVGEDWRFGKGGRGEAQLLAEFCRKHDLLFRAVKRLTLNGINISSSAVRELAAQGEIAKAAQLLGRDLELSGTVVQGFRIAGKELAAPTANLKLDHGLMLPDGVYAGAVTIEEGSFAAVLNIGIAPTYSVNERRVEVHLLNFSGPLYGKKLTVRVLGYLRPEKKFPSPAALKEQIVRDIARASEIYENMSNTGG